ncbi:MAG: cell division protein ZapE [Pseudomonadales bacterium]|nr:cell division protein ZapE [Pseudomonadales bacterium]
MTPIEKYRKDLQQEGFNFDPAQEAAVKQLQDLYERLTAPAAAPTGLLQRFRRRFEEQTAQPERGLYFWGGVGRGKTYLMDLFYECLPFENKTRIHFHRFMQKVHHRLKELEGAEDPLKSIGADLATRARVICFDEFFVSDITDAMILGRLLEHMFANGMCLVTTSNIAPDRLYENGLQRSQFLPAIALLNQHTKSVQVDGGTDHRLRALQSAELYHSPLDGPAETSLNKSFQLLSCSDLEDSEPLIIEGREMTPRHSIEDVVWFEFDELCNGPRSQNDYIELARIFHTVLISNVPQFNIETEDLARRFINLIDEFYDRSVKLIVSAEVAIEHLYAGKILEFEFERTCSRLLEMQSEEYLAREHKP